MIVAVLQLLYKNSISCRLRFYFFRNLFYWKFLNLLSLRGFYSIFIVIFKSLLSHLTFYFENMIF